ncbi:MAG: serine acetyltransferase [Acutalibacteraceae bacterium]
MKELDDLSFTERFFRARLQHYDEKKYWRRRNAVIAEQQTGLSRICNLYRLYYIKKCDAFNNASLGTHLGFGATFAGIPKLPHGLYGIIISHNAVIGKECKIFHQVTIGEGKNGAPTIGDNVLIGAGAKIIGNVTIGDNARIGAGCVIVHDVPANAIVAAPAAVEIERKDNP